jgi:hypothetical protein
MYRFWICSKKFRLQFGGVSWGKEGAHFIETNANCQNNATEFFRHPSAKKAFRSDRQIQEIPGYLYHESAGVRENLSHSKLSRKTKNPLSVVFHR